MVKRIARIFIRKTQYTPEDDLVFFGPPGLLIPKIDEVHVSCLFTWDKPRAEYLAKMWKRIAPVKIGGPAYLSMDTNNEFIPGRYIKKEEYTFTSRGCSNKCPFCFVPKMEGDIREIKNIHAAPYLMDNNILACSDKHIEKVFNMLLTQKNIKLQGGIDVRLLKKWHVEYISKMKLNNIAIAFDSPNLELKVKRSLKLLLQGNIPYGKIHCFVLGGFFKNDTPEKAEQRCRFVLEHGATPNAMYYRNTLDGNPKKPKEWSDWSLRWQWQRGIYAMAKRENLKTYKKGKKNDG